MERFICTHCSHRFESTPQEGISCPHCFWSTSVKREEDLTPEVESKEVPQEVSGETNPLGLPSPRFLFWVGGSLVLLLLILFLGRSCDFQKKEKTIKTEKSESASKVTLEAFELTLLPEEREILNRRLAVESKGALTESEKEILAGRISLRSLLSGIYVELN